ncbi:MAG: flavin reductase family protein [Ruminococcaceae bacterium]|nr:flavin reductase family protein [Oscillospiraceae bacterium]
MKKTLKGSTMLGPLPPVMVSCRLGDKDNIITAAWTGTINTRPPKTYVSIRPTRYSYNIIKKSGEFVINLTPASLVGAADYCGTYTGAKVDKFKECGLTKEEATEINAPMIAECPVSLECKVFDVIPLGSHDMFLADIVAVNVAEELFDGEGKIHMERADLVAFLHGAYYSIGEKLDKIGCGIVKKGSKKMAKNGPKKTPEKKKK